LTEIAVQFEVINTAAFVREIMDALPYPAMVINQHRQVVFSNKPLVDLLGIQNIDQILGQRPGEAMNCIHAWDNAAGCGTSESCAVCGAVLAILESRRVGEKVSQECRLTLHQTGTDASQSVSSATHRGNPEPALFHCGGEWGTDDRSCTD
jgi:hypothetical protein